MSKQVCRNYGKWEYDPELMTLTYEGHYEIDLEKIDSSAEMLDWIFQVNHKAWGWYAVVDLIDAFDRLLSPQANYCSWGEEHNPNPTEILKELSVNRSQFTREDRPRPRHW